MKNAHQTVAQHRLHHTTLTLKELSAEELLEQYKNLGDDLNHSLATCAPIEILNTYQAQIASVREELHKKANLKSSSTFQRAYYTLFLS